MKRKIDKSIKPEKVTRDTTEDSDASSIVDYYMRVGIMKSPKEYKMGDRVTTDWFDGLDAKEKERVWKDAGTAWWKAYGIKNYDELYTNEIASERFVEGDIQDYYMKKVYDRLRDGDNDIQQIMKKKYNNKKKKKHNLPKNKMRMPDSNILNNRGYKFGGGMAMKNKITEVLLETELQSTAPFSVESNDVWGGWIRIQYDNQSGTTTEGVEELIKVLQAELFGWEYVMKHEEFFWKDGAWENKFDKE